MRQFNTILAAIDFSTYSKAVARHSMDLARELGSNVIFLNVINQHDINIIRFTLKNFVEGLDVDFAANEYIDTIKNERNEKMEDLVHSVNTEELPYEVVVYTGIPYQGLLKAIPEFNVDLVVIGAKGKSDAKDASTGSTAWKLFRRCPIPLVTVREYKP